jgi:hypothetical protein
MVVFSAQTGWIFHRAWYNLRSLERTERDAGECVECSEADAAHLMTMHVGAIQQLSMMQEVQVHAPAEDDNMAQDSTSIESHVPPPTCSYVEGAGSSRVNGTYTRCAQDTGRPSYEKTAVGRTEAQLDWHPEMQVWMMTGHFPKGSITLYTSKQNGRHAAFPPTTGWERGGPGCGVSPAPTLRIPELEMLKLLTPEHANCVELRPAEVPSFNSVRDDGIDSGIESRGGCGGILQRKIREQREARVELEVDVDAGHDDAIVTTASPVITCNPLAGGMAQDGVGVWHSTTTVAMEDFV